jgi:MscS family membrane protein
MRSIVKRFFIILLPILITFLLLNFYLPTRTKSVASNLEKGEMSTSNEKEIATETSSDPETGKLAKQPQKVDLAGEKVGQKIDNFTRKASSRIGGWINTEVFAGITWFKLTLSFFLLFIVLLIERIVRLIIDRKSRKPEEEKEVKTIKYLALQAAAKPLSMFIWVYGIYIVLTPLFVHFRQPDGTNWVHSAAQKAVDLGVTVAIFWFIFRLVSIVDFHIRKWAASTDSTIDDVLAPLAGKTLRVFIVIIGGILVIQNLTGVKIGPLLASLGIGGIAVALAARDSIANFFGTLTILFDKPFQVGERIIIDNYDGVVQDVGFRSTRIRTLTGHLVTIPNEKVVNSGLENIGKRPHIRWLTNITITYDTPPDRVKKAVSIIEEILDHHEGMHPDFPPRVYFNGFNEWSLNIMVIAWYHPANYWDMQEWLQRTCLAILERFNDEGIDFAFPSRTLYLESDDKCQLNLKMLQGETVTYIPERESND